MQKVIQIDTRQQRGAHNAKNAWFAAHGVETVEVTLKTGDYAAAGSNVLVDTKKDLQELAGNIGKQHARFRREIDRAAAKGCRLVVLVEEHPEYNERALIDTWVPTVCRMCRKCDPRREQCKAHKFKPIQGVTVRKIMDKLESDHGARFLFCDKRDTARVICDLLGVGYER